MKYNFVLDFNREEYSERDIYMISKGFMMRSRSVDYPGPYPPPPPVPWHPPSYFSSYPHHPFPQYLRLPYQQPPPPPPPAYFVPSVSVVKTESTEDNNDDDADDDNAVSVIQVTQSSQKTQVPRYQPWLPWTTPVSNNSNNSRVSDDQDTSQPRLTNTRSSSRIIRQESVIKVCFSFAAT